MIEDNKKERIDPKQLGLLDRELQILSLISQGLSNKEIAGKLFISDGTVRNYITVLLDKLSLRG